MRVVKKDFFKGKTYNYSTSVTVTKLECVMAWILGLSAIIGSFLIILFVDSFFVIFLSIFIFIILFIIFGIIVIFSRKHKEERLKNTQVYKEK